MYSIVYIRTLYEGKPWPWKDQSQLPYLHRQPLLLKNLNINIKKIKVFIKLLYTKVTEPEFKYSSPL